MRVLDLIRPRRKRPARITDVVLLAVVTLGLAWTALPGGLRLGGTPTLAALDDLRLTTLVGVPVQPTALAAGRPVVLNLWASWCGPCRAEMPLLAAAEQEHPDIAFLFANQGEDAFVAQRYAAESAPTLRHVLLDPRTAVGKAAGSRALPITLFYDAAGRRADVHLGALTPQSLEAALRRIAPTPSPR